MCAWGIFVFSAWLARAEGEISAERKNYDNDAVFEQLSGAKRAILEQKFGPKTKGTSQAPPSAPRSAKPPQPPISPLALPANTQVNNPAADATTQDTQSETALVLGSGSNIVAAFNDSGSNVGGVTKFTGFARSTNGGTSFTDMGPLPTNVPDGDAGDPVLARSAKTGTIFLATLAFVNSQDLEFFRSTDNGATFIVPAINSAPGFTPTTGDQDKEWIAVDNFAGTGFGNVYQFWRNFGSPGGMTFTRSTDDGLTWGPSGGLTLASGGQGASVCVGQDHAVYCFWHDASVTPREIKMRKSTDQGVSFASAVTVTTLAATAVNGDLGLEFRTNSFPQSAANPINANILYLVFNDDPAGLDRGDIFFTQSNNGGGTWSAPVRLNSDPSTADNFVPRFAVTPDGSKLFVAWYDRRRDPSNSAIDVFGAIATLSGTTTTFGPNFLITDQSFPPVFGQDGVVNSAYMGDYDTAAADNSFFYTTWGDNRLSLGTHAHQPDIRFAKIPVTGLGPIILPDATTVLGEAFFPPNGRIEPSEKVTVDFTLINFGDPTSNLTATIQGTGGVIPIPSVQSQNYGVIASGGGTAARPFTFTNNVPCGETLTVTLHLQDGATDLGNVTFSFVLGEGTPNSFAGGGITINDATSGTPYPSSIAVSGITGPISRVTVTLNGLTHTFPSDLDILLVGPTGEKSIVMSDVGGGTDVTAVTVTFDDLAASAPGATLTPGTYKPTDLSPGDIFPIGPPLGPYGASFSVFSGLSGSSVNGTWSLYLADDAGGDIGTLAGWTLNIYTFGCSGGISLCGGPTVINGSIDASDLTQSDRLAIPGSPSSCAVPRVCPGAASAGVVHYDAYTFVNNTLGTACVTVGLNTPCTGSNAIFSAAYLGAYDPDNLCTNFLAHEGNSPNPSNNYSFNLASGARTVIVVNGVASGTACGSYTLTVTGDCLSPTLTPTPSPTPTASSSPTPSPTPTASASPTPSPSPFNSALAIGNSIPSQMSPGQLLNVTLTMRNNGNATWTAAGGYEFFVLSDPCGMLPGSAISFGPGDAVPPFTNWDFLTTIVAPGAPASCNLQLRMRQGGIPFGATMSKTVTVKTPANVVRDWTIFE